MDSSFDLLGIICLSDFVKPVDLEELPLSSEEFDKRCHELMLETGVYRESNRLRNQRLTERDYQIRMTC